MTVSDLIQQPLIPTAPRVACRVCRVVFEDLNGHTLCDTYLVEHINGAGELELDDDELFPERPAASITPRLIGAQSCAACGLRADVLLCKECLQDVPQARQHVHTWLDGVLAQMDQHIAAFEALRGQHSAFWAKIEDARLSERPDADARARAAHPIYAQLIDAEQAMQQALEPLGNERWRLEKALEVLSTVPDAPAMRPNEYAIPKDATPTTCRSCGAGMVFVKTAHGKALPLSLATVQERGGGYVRAAALCGLQRRERME